MIRADDVLALVARGSQRGEVIGRIDQVAGLAGERVAGAVRGHDRVAVGREQAAAFERRVSGRMLERPARMTKEAWLAHWHGVQSPVSEELQPRMRYVRNEVIRPLTPDAPPWEGIVDECWPSAEHLTEGSEERLRTNLKRMLESVRGFLELPRIRSYAMSEYILRSR